MGERTEHRSQIPRVAVELGDRVAAAGGQLYIVGGWVRDRLMGRQSWEIDLATSLTPSEMKSAVEGLGSVFDIGERFGTVGLRADETLLEITTFRADEYAAGSRHPQVTPVRDIEEDLARRDFTINSMALSGARPRQVVRPVRRHERYRAAVYKDPG